jgi:hypothetical protein
MKNSVTAAGIEPATFRFVAQHLNHCTTAVPAAKNYVEYKSNLMNSFHLLSSVLLLSDFPCTFIVHERIFPTSKSTITVP